MFISFSCLKFTCDPIVVKFINSPAFACGSVLAILSVCVSGGLFIDPYLCRLEHRVAWQADWWHSGAYECIIQQPHDHPLPNHGSRLPLSAQRA